jgi:hypothetical protein
MFGDNAGATFPLLRELLGKGIKGAVGNQNEPHATSASNHTDNNARKAFELRNIRFSKFNNFQTMQITLLIIIIVMLLIGTVYYLLVIKKAQEKALKEKKAYFNRAPSTLIYADSFSRPGSTLDYRSSFGDSLVDASNFRPSKVTSLVSDGSALSSFSYKGFRG